MNERFFLNEKAVREFLWKERQTAGWLADKIRASKTTVTRILAGYVPKYRTLEALAQLMGVEVQTLLIPKAKAG